MHGSARGARDSGRRDNRVDLDARDAWAGRDTAFSLEDITDPPFDRRLALAGRPRGRWIVLTYRDGPNARPLRPMVRLHRAGGTVQDFVLPGDVCGSARWLGWLPRDLDEIRLAAGPGFRLERVSLREMASLLAECAAKQPIRLGPALYALARGDERRYRDILRGVCAVTPLGGYKTWRARRARPSTDGTTTALSIRLILPASRTNLIAATLASLEVQSHQDWRLVIAAPQAGRPADPRITVEAWDAAAPAARLIGTADALCLLQPGDVLEPDALALLARALAAPDAPDLVYGDEESAGAVPGPRLKPDWSPDLALATGYHGSPTLLSRALIGRLGERPSGSPEAFGIAAAAAALQAVHIPRILCRTARQGRRQDEVPARAALLDRHLRETGSPARAAMVGGVLDLAWPCPDPAPLASIVIPSRNRLDLIARVTEGVLYKTDYPAIELVIVDNGSTDPDVLRLYERLKRDERVCIESFPHPFDYSAMTNTGVRASRGTVVVLLNNDIAVLHPDWLDAMVAQAVRPEVGAVGAKLLYADGRLQHGGVVVGLGGRAGHILRRRPGDAPGHLNRMRVAHEVSAVTAACLAVTRAKYDAVGGLDEKTFPIDFNDVDFCLRLNAAGWKTMWTPRAVLSHLESVSRGPPVGAARARFEREAEAFSTRWRDVIRHDPFYHPGLSLTTFGEDLE